MTSDEHEDFRLLSLANEKGKFALEIAYGSADFQSVFERGIDKQWFTMVDISPLPHATPNDRRLFRIFRLTDAGWSRRRVLEAMSRGGAA